MPARSPMRTSLPHKPNLDHRPDVLSNRKQLSNKGIGLNEYHLGKNARGTLKARVGAVVQRIGVGWMRARPGAGTDRHRRARPSDDASGDRADACGHASSRTG